MNIEDPVPRMYIVYWIYIDTYFHALISKGHQKDEIVGFTVK